jgi:Nickel responsive protein SCO4226-like
MPKYLIERNLPGAGQLTGTELQQIARKSCAVLHDLGPAVQWIESYVTSDRFYCVYFAPEEALIREHALRGGFPADQVNRISRIIDPATAE